MRLFLEHFAELLVFAADVRLACPLSGHRRHRCGRRAAAGNPNAWPAASPLSAHKTHRTSSFIRRTRRLVASVRSAQRVKQRARRGPRSVTASGVGSSIGFQESDAKPVNRAPVAERSRFAGPQELAGPFPRRAFPAGPPLNKAGLAGRACSWQKDFVSHQKRTSATSLHQVEPHLWSNRFLIVGADCVRLDGRFRLQTDSAPSSVAPEGPLLFPIEASEAAVCYVRNTSIGGVEWLATNARSRPILAFGPRAPSVELAPSRRGTDPSGRMGSNPP